MLQPVEASFGDVLPGDPLAYWKYSDTPMCEFWQPYDRRGVGHPNYKPVKPCVSAAHLYGKRRIAAESFTNTRMTWDENFRILKEQAVRHFARGVTHLVTHTCTHNPQINLPGPGTSFGSYIGMPFLRKQTWWSFMPSFTGWIKSCGAFLERGKPVVDVLRYVGDDYAHRPDECDDIPSGYKCDYLNADVLFSRIKVSGGRLLGGAIWVQGCVGTPQWREHPCGRGHVYLVQPSCARVRSSSRSAPHLDHLDFPSKDSAVLLARRVIASVRSAGTGARTVLFNPIEKTIGNVAKQCYGNRP